MRISEINLAGQGAWPAVHIENLVDGLNVVHTGNRGGKSTLAGLVGHLLYGKVSEPRRLRLGPTLGMPDGNVQVTIDSENLWLRREANPQGEVQLFASGSDGEQVGTRWLRSALGEIPAKRAAEVLAVDFGQAPNPLRLLDEPFAQYFGSNLTQANEELTTRRPVDKQRVEELVRRRNAIAQQLEQRMQAGRRDSHVLQQEADKIDADLQERRQQVSQLQTKLRDIETELARLATALRYHALDENSTRATRAQAEEHQSQLQALDHEILRCRQALADTQARSSELQTELAKLTSDGSADRVTALSDSRRTVGVLERLVEDLDCEVAQLARTNRSKHPVGEDAHARFSPIAELLRKQVYSLCGQISEQQRSVRRQAIQAEVRQLNRIQTELSDRLEQLLSNREALVEVARAPHLAGPVVPTAPAPGFCNCENHGHHVSTISPDAHWADEDHATEMHGRLERERYQLLNNLSALGREVVQLENRWKRLQEERAGLVEGASIEADRAEIDRLESLLKHALDVQSVDPVQQSSLAWSASDILAQLTGGRLVQVRLSRDSHKIRIIDNHRQTHRIDSLNPVERDQLYLALTLSLVSSLALEGMHLPLVLDEPFIRQDESAAAVMAGVLERFGRAGHQILLLTDHSRALESLESIGAHIIQLGVEAPTPKPKPQTTTVKTKSARLVRETLDGEQSPGLRLASGHGAGNIEAVFYLSIHSSLNEFPVLGKDTAAVFSPLGIHCVGDLLAGDAVEIARRLDRHGITEATVRLWQSHMRLLCEVPELTLNDAQLLTAVGIMSPHELRHARTSDLWKSISSFLQTDRGSRYASARGRYTRERMDDWNYAAGGARERTGSRGARSNRSRSESNRSSRRRRSESNGSRRAARSDSREQTREWRFHLEPSSDVEAAPSIGPKTAERLAKVGIHTVTDLLEADPKGIAEQLDVKHIRSKTIVEWQNQARLVCQIPELHGYGAMLLVACGLTEPEEISSFDPAELITRVQELCDTKQGQRILRSADPPSAKRIRRWIELAQHCRSLEAA